MTFIQLGLIFLYVCVLVIKSCDLPAGRTATAEAENVARAMCSTYGFGDSPEAALKAFGAAYPHVCARGLPSPPQCRHLPVLCCLRAVAARQSSCLWALAIVAGGHHAQDSSCCTCTFDVSPDDIAKGLGSQVTSTFHACIVWHLAACSPSAQASLFTCSYLSHRRASYCKGRIIHWLRLDGARLSPRAAAAVLKFRSTHGFSAPQNVPPELKQFFDGVPVEMYIKDIFPHTTCFVQVDLTALAIRWTHEHFLCLQNVESVLQPGRKVRRNSTWSKFARRASNAMFGSPDALKTSISASAVVKAAHGARRASNAVIEAVGLGIQVPLHIVYRDRKSQLRILELRMPQERISVWDDGLRKLLTSMPHLATPAHCRWVYSCMAATSERGATGFLRRSELRSLLRCSNATPQLTLDAINEAERAILRSEVLVKLPQWLRAAQSGIVRSRSGFGRRLSAAAIDLRSRPKGPNTLTTRQVSTIMLQLSTASVNIKKIFDRYALNGQMTMAQWLEFEQAEQIPGGANGNQRD
eukprot:4142497-Prymnesium_polylepis.3